MNPWSVFFNTWDTTQGVAWENYGKLMNMISNILKVFMQTNSPENITQMTAGWSRWTSEVGSIMAQAFQKVFAEIKQEDKKGKAEKQEGNQPQTGCEKADKALEVKARTRGEKNEDEEGMKRDEHGDKKGDKRETSGEQANTTHHIEAIEVEGR